MSISSSLGSATSRFDTGRPARRALDSVGLRGAQSVARRRISAESARLVERRNPLVTVVLPVYNEAESLQEFNLRLGKTLDACCLAACRGPRSWEAVYVNDGSTDATARLLGEMARADGRIVVVNLRRNFGQTAALSAGMDHAHGDVIITMDTDLQHLPEEIPRFMEKISAGHEVVLGYRGDRRDSFLRRRLPSRCANALMRRLSGVAVRDFGSTFKAFRRDVIGEFEMFGDVHRFLPVLGAMAGLDMAEVAITNAPRKAGKSKYGLGRTFGVLVDILTLGFFSSYLTRPGRPWGYLAMLFGGFGLAIQGTLVVLYVLGILPNILERPGWLLLSVLMDVTGLQCLGFGVMSELLGRTYFASRRKPIYSIRSILRAPETDLPRRAATS